MAVMDRINNLLPIGSIQRGYAVAAAGSAPVVIIAEHKLRDTKASPWKRRMKQTANTIGGVATCGLWTGYRLLKKLEVVGTSRTGNTKKRKTKKAKRSTSQADQLGMQVLRELKRANNIGERLARRKSHPNRIKAPSRIVAHKRHRRNKR